MTIAKISLHYILKHLMSEHEIECGVCEIMTKKIQDGYSDIASLKRSIQKEISFR